MAMGLTVLCPPTRLVLKAHGIESLEMTLRDPNGVLLNFIQNVKGGIGPGNRFPGLARKAATRTARKPLRKAAKKSAKNKMLKNKPRTSLKLRSGASRRRRSG
jgi:hypothetical protein